MSFNITYKGFTKCIQELNYLFEKSFLFYECEEGVINKVKINKLAYVIGKKNPSYEPLRYYICKDIAKTFNCKNIQQGEKEETLVDRLT